MAKKGAPKKKGVAERIAEHNERIRAELEHKATCKAKKCKRCEAA